MSAAVGVGTPITVIIAIWKEPERGDWSDNVTCPLRMYGSTEWIHKCDHPKANLLDDGVVDTLVSVGATSGIHTSVYINVSDSARIRSRSTSRG
jgi:hypothetical protein